MAEKIGRDGSPKRLAVVHPHPGMRFVRSLDGTHFVGASRTQAEHPADGKPSTPNSAKVSDNIFGPAFASQLSVGLDT